LLEGKCDLLLRKPADLHGMTSFSSGEKSSRNFYFLMVKFLGAGSFWSGKMARYTSLSWMYAYAIVQCR
jgi:hypothetical protein